MKNLYQLTIYDIESCYDDYKEGFVIGCFSSFEKAEQTAEMYLKNIQGFKDYDCDYEITEKGVIGTEDKFQYVYLIEGWNINQNFDEIDIIESEYFTDKQTVEKELARMKAEYDRSEWTLDRYTVDECHWTEGFVRS